MVHQNKAIKYIISLPIQNTQLQRRFAKMRAADNEQGRSHTRVQQEYISEVGFGQDSGKQNVSEYVGVQRVTRLAVRQGWASNSMYCN